MINIKKIEVTGYRLLEDIFLDFTNKKALNEPRLKDLLCSTYATLEGNVELNKEED